MRILSLFAALVVAAGCSKEAPPPPPKVHAAPPAQSPLDDALARARALDASRERMRAVPGTFAAGDASARFVAYWDSGVLRLIDERSEFGDYGTSSARYYLDATGRLFLYETRDERPRADATGKEAVELRLVFDPDSRMLASEKKVDGKVQPTQATEIQGVRDHLQALIGSARAP